MEQFLKEHWNVSNRCTYPCPFTRTVQWYRESRNTFVRIFAGIFPDQCCLGIVLCEWLSVSVGYMVRIIVKICIMIHETEILLG